MSNLDLDKKHLSHAYIEPRKSKFYGAKEVVDAKGIRIKLSNGEELIDGLSGLWNVNVGHGRKEIAKAANKQMEKLPYYPSAFEYTTEPPIKLAEKLTSLLPRKSKIEKLTWVDSVITIIDVPLLKSTDENLMERLKNYKTLAYPEIDRKRGFEEILNSPIYKNYVISEDGKTSGIVVYIKKDKRLAEYIKVKNKYFDQLNDTGLSKDERINYKNYFHLLLDYCLYHEDQYRHYQILL